MLQRYTLLFHCAVDDSGLRFLPLLISCHHFFQSTAHTVAVGGHDSSTKPTSDEASALIVTSGPTTHTTNEVYFSIYQYMFQFLFLIYACFKQRNGTLNVVLKVCGSFLELMTPECIQCQIKLLVITSNLPCTCMELDDYILHNTH